MIALLAGFALLALLLLGGGALARAPVALIRRILTVLVGGVGVALVGLLLVLTGRVGMLLSLWRLYGRFGLSGLAGMAGRAGARPSGWPPPGPSANRMTRADAQAILGVGEGAGAEEINSAWKKLMMKVHPDHGGTDALAARVNEARRTLLG